jgi:cytochrome bd-type quinol oxidase subunit 1
MDYPVWEVAGIGGGWLIGIVAIAHVIVSHFAIGGGGIMVLAETLGARKGKPALVDFARRHSYVLVALSSVFGAISGVAIWFTIGSVHPRATSTLIHNFVWGWAIEWAFFIVEIATALVYWQTWNRISARTHRIIGWIYFIAAYLSLVVINGILAFMITPGHWLETGSFIHAFLNPSYLPSLVLRTGVAAMIGGAVALVLGALRKSRDERGPVQRLGGFCLAAGSLLALPGLLWWERVLPEGARSAFAPDGYVAGTHDLLLLALAGSFLFGLIASLIPRRSPLFVAVLGAAAAAATLGAFERVREASRRPFVIYGYMYSNGILIDDVVSFQEEGFSKSGWPALAASAEDGERLSQWGRQLHLSQCSSCHTLDGYRSLKKLTAEMEAEDIASALEILEEMNPRMPPFAGNREDREALASFLDRLKER